MRTNETFPLQRSMTANPLDFLAFAQGCCLKLVPEQRRPKHLPGRLRVQAVPSQLFRPKPWPTGKGVANYEVLKQTCLALPSKPKCCPKANTRKEHEDAIDAARAIRKTRQSKVSSKLRKKVEMLFAHLKRMPVLGRLRLRGPCGANDEFLLAATARNFRKLAS